MVSEDKIDREIILNEIAVLQGFASKVSLDKLNKEALKEIKDHISYLLEKLNELELGNGW